MTSINYFQLRWPADPQKDIYPAGHTRLLLDQGCQAIQESLSDFLGAVVHHLRARPTQNND